MLFNLILTILPFFNINPINTVAETGATVVQKSIAYHDPGDAWEKWKAELVLKEIRPDGSSRNTTIKINRRKSLFSLSQNRDSAQIFFEVKGEQCRFKINGSDDYSAAQAEQYKLNDDRAKLMRNYYVYLWALPMKLKDPGTIIHDAVETVTYQGKSCFKVKVTYSEEVGKDTWYFYFAQENYALHGYQFYHDESKNDGEYITLEGQESIGGIRIPKARKWYVNKDDAFLGEDILQ